MTRLSVRLFALCWEEAASVTHASVLLRRQGVRVSPNRVDAMAKAFRLAGVQLKEMPKSDLPRFLSLEPASGMLDRLLLALPAGVYAGRDEEGLVLLDPRTNEVGRVILERLPE
jgi:hypothetical protein